MSIFFRASITNVDEEDVFFISLIKYENNFEPELLGVLNLSLQLSSVYKFY